MLENMQLKSELEESKEEVQRLQKELESSKIEAGKISKDFEMIQASLQNKQSQID